MPKKGDDISTVAIDVTAGQEKVLELVRKKGLEATQQQEVSKRQNAEIHRKEHAKEATRNSPPQQQVETDEESAPIVKPKRRKRSTDVSQGGRTDEHPTGPANSRWVTPTFKVKEERQQALERIYFLLRANGELTGTKQAFFDEGLAYLEGKYSKVGNTA